MAVPLQAVQIRIEFEYKHLCCDQRKYIHTRRDVTSLQAIIIIMKVHSSVIHEQLRDHLLQELAFQHDSYPYL